MTLSEIKTMLESITGFSNKVAYYAFPVGNAPALPFICFYETDSDNFAADGIVYHAIKDITVELYSENRDIASEALIEAALLQSGIFWQKSIDYVDDEKMYMTIYEFEV